MKILFICESVTLAHLTRAIVLANQLSEQKNNEVLLASNYEINELKKDFYNLNNNIKILKINSISNKKFLNSLEHGLWPYNYHTLRKYHQEDLKLINSFSPNIVIGDFRLSLETTCKYLKVPFLGLVNAYWHSSIHNNILTVPNYSTLRYLPLKIAQGLFSKLTPFALKSALKQINKLRIELSLSKFKDFERYFCLDKNAIYPDMPIIFNRFNKPLNGKFIGFTNWSPNINFDHNIISKDRKNIFLSLGSSGSINVINKIILALNELNLNVILSSANRKIKISKELSFTQYDYLPGLEIAKKVDLVITNGGSPSTYQAISVKTPVLGIPSNLDQFLCMKALEHNVYIEFIRADRFNMKDFKTKVRNLLNNEIAIKELENLNTELLKFKTKESLAKLILSKTTPLKYSQNN